MPQAYRLDPGDLHSKQSSSWKSVKRTENRSTRRQRPDTANTPIEISYQVSKSQPNKNDLSCASSVSNETRSDMTTNDDCTVDGNRLNESRTGQSPWYKRLALGGIKWKQGQGGYSTERRGAKAIKGRSWRVRVPFVRKPSHMASSGRKGSRGCQRVNGFVRIANTRGIRLLAKCAMVCRQLEVDGGRLACSRTAATHHLNHLGCQCRRAFP